ncbi:hypothetical protein ABVT39_003314 [Epinephelus coioides]
MKWSDALDYCRLKYTDLATVDSMDDANQLNRPSSYTSWVWIGLTDDPKSWKGTMGNDANSWRWSATGETSKTGYQNWKPGQPNHYTGHQTCVVAETDGRWNDLGCDTKLYFVCYNDTIPPSQKTFTLIKTSLTWEDAQTYCRTHHTDLAMIENAQENTEILSLVYNVWIGLYRVLWRWSDKSKSSFRNWQSGQPNNYLNQYCAGENSVHKWADLNCDDEIPFWCYKAVTLKMTVRMKIQTDADLSDSATNAQILQQLGAAITNKTSATDFNLSWKTQPRKQEETDVASGCPD